MTRNIEVQLASPFSGYLIKYWCLNDTSQCFDRWNTLYRVWQITPTFWKFFTFSVSVFRCVFVNIQLVIMSAGQRILILEALLVKVLFRCTIARIWGLAERSCFRKTLLWVLSLSLCLFVNVAFLTRKREKVISTFIGTTTLVSVVLRVQHWYPRARDLTELELQ